MNRKQFVILLVLVVVLGGGGLVLYKKQTASRNSGSQGLGQKLLGDLPMNDVAHITIKRGTNELNLVKKDDLWRVRERNDYPANYSEISETLLKLRDLKIVQVEQVGPSQLPRLELATGQGTNSGVLLELKDQSDKPIKSLVLGKKHVRKSERPSQFGEEGWPDGRWVLMASSAQKVAVISDPLANLEPKPEQWLNKDFFKVEKVRAVSVNFPNATNSWKLTRETESGEWKLVDAKPGEQLDSAKASGVSNPLASPSFVDVVSASAQPEAIGLDKPTVATLETFDNLTYTIKVGKKSDDNYHLAMTLAADLPKERAPGKDEKVEDKDKLDKEFKEKQTKLEEKLKQEKSFEKWTYLVSSWTVDPLLKERAQILVEKKEEPKKEEPKKDDKPTQTGEAEPDSK